MKKIITRVLTLDAVAGTRVRLLRAKVGDLGKRLEPAKRPTFDRHQGEFSRTITPTEINAMNKRAWSERK